VEIQINKTAAPDDDLVLLKSQHPAAQPTVDCQIRLTSNETKPVKVVLHDPTTKLQFPNSSTVTLTLPVDKSFVAFRITGQTASTAIGDCSVEAHVDSVLGALVGKQRVTVVSFAPARLTLAQGGDYGLAGQTLTVTTPANPTAVNFSAQATVRPAGVNCAAPQLRNIRVAFMQESSGFVVTRVWNNPTVVFDPAVCGKTVIEPVTISTRETYAAAVHQPVNDGVAGAFPLYARTAAALQIPLGCAGGAASTSNDTPSSPFPATFRRPAVATDGSAAGTTIWQTQVHITRQEHFRTYCVVFDTVSGAFSALRQGTWDMNVDSALANQHVTVSADTAANANPVAVPPTATDAPADATVAAVGAATMPFNSRPC